MSKTQQQSQENTLELPQSSSTQVATESNAQKVLNLREKEGTAEGLSNYQQVLGSWFGGELYAAVAPFLSHDQIGEYADQGLDALVKNLESYLKGLDGDIEPDVFDKVFEEINSDVEGLAERFVNDQGAGLVNALGGWVDAHPRVIVGVAILAAIGAYLTDMNIPDLSKRFNMGENFSAKIGANIGRLQNIALEKISAELEYKSGLLVAAIEVNRSREGTSAVVSGSYGEKGKQIKGTVEVDENGIKAYGTEGEIVIDESNFVRGKLEGGRATKGVDVSVELESKDGTTTVLNNVSYNTSTGELSSAEIKEDQWLGGTLRSENQISTEGGSSTVGWTGQINDQTTLNAQSSHSAEGHVVEAQSVYTEDDFKAELDLVYQDQGVSKATAKVENKVSDDLLSSLSMGIDSNGIYYYDAGLDYEKNGLKSGIGLSGDSAGQLTASGSVDYTKGNHNVGAALSYDVPAGQLSELSAHYNFKDDKSFNSFLAEYRYNLDPVAQHNFDMTIQREIFDMRWRLVEKMSYNNQDGLSANTTLLGAKALNDEYSVIGGVRHEYVNGEQNVLPQLGIQYNDIPIVVEFDPKNNGASVRLEFKF